MSDDLDAKVLAATGWSPLRKALHASARGAAVKVIEFDGCGGRLRGVPLGLRTLSADESLRLRAEAFRWLSTECGFSADYIVGSADGESHLAFEVKVRTLALALVEPGGTNAPVAKDADDLRKMLEADEVTQLFEAYLDWTAERSPISSAKTAEEVRDLVDAMGKAMAPTSRLNAYDSVSLRIIATELVNRVRALTSAPSSPTPSSSDTATASSDTSG
jgi:hypothetical protein